MDERAHVFPKSNLGEGEQWAREVQKTLIKLEKQIRANDQLIKNLNRKTNASSMSAADVYRSLGSIEEVIGENGVFAGDLANRISGIESTVQAIKRAMFPAEAISVSGAAGQSIAAGVYKSVAQIVLEVPAGAHFVTIMAHAKLSIANTPSSIGFCAVGLNGTEFPGSFSPAATNASLQNVTETSWAFTVSLNQGQTQVTINNLAYVTAATTTGEPTSLSVHAVFQF